MHRLPRILRHTATALSLLLCTATLALWIRSYTRSEGVARYETGVDTGAFINVSHFIGVRNGRFRALREVHRIHTDDPEAASIQWAQKKYRHAHWDWRPLGAFRPADYLPQGRDPVHHLGPFYAWINDDHRDPGMQSLTHELGGP